MSTLRSISRPVRMLRSLLFALSVVALVISGLANEHIFCHVIPLEHSQDTYTCTAGDSKVGEVELRGGHAPSESEEETFLRHVDQGRPFLVPRVSEGWQARHKWTHEYFAELFREAPLFSSAFTTHASPDISSPEDSYYGIFLNDPALAELVSEDYTYPKFVPKAWRMEGML